MGLLITSLVYGLILMGFSLVISITSVGREGQKITGGAVAFGTVLVLLAIAGPAAMPAMGYHGLTVFVPAFWLVATNLYSMAHVVMRIGQVHPKTPRTPNQALWAATTALIDLAAFAVLLSVAL